MRRGTRAHAPTRELRREHRRFLRRLALLEKRLDQAEQGEIPMGRLRAMARRQARDLENHLRVEEEDLFPRLAHTDLGHPGGGIGTLLSEHALLRKYLNEFLSAMDAGAAAPAGEAVAPARSFLWLIRDHIDKEDTVYFPRMDALLARSA